MDAPHEPEETERDGYYNKRNMKTVFFHGNTNLIFVSGSFCFEVTLLRFIKSRNDLIRGQFK